MEKVYLGKITSFHGVKGEIRIRSDFDYKDEAFKVGNKVLIDDNVYIINSYRRHKDYEMIKLDNYNDLDSVMFLKNKKVYIDKKDLLLDEDTILDNDYIGMKVISNNDDYGIVKEIYKMTFQKKIIVVEYKEKEILIPFELKESVDKERKIIYIKYVEGLF